MIDETSLWHYRCTVRRVIDGDTLEVTLDAGFHLTAALRLRLLGVNCCELRDADPAKRALANQAAEVVRGYCPEGQRIYVRTEKDDAFGRYLADVWVDGVNLNRRLVEMGLATEGKR